MSVAPSTQKAHMPTSYIPRTELEIAAHTAQLAGLVLDHDIAQRLPWHVTEAMLSVARQDPGVDLAAAGEEPTRAAVKAAVARERPKASTAKVTEKQKPFALDMRSAVEALMASDPALHREFLVAASEHLTDVDSICAVMRALLNRMHPKNVAALLVDVFSRPEFVRAVADFMIERLDAQEKEDDAKGPLDREARA